MGSRLAELGAATLLVVALAGWGGSAAEVGASPQLSVQEYRVPAGSHPHDVAPARDGTIWYTGQHSGELGRLDPRTGGIRRVPLGSGSAPHGVIVGPDGAAWVTDGGLNAIVRVDARTLRIRRFKLPGSGYANLNTATFDKRGVLWFTGQSGVYGRVDPRTGRVRVFSAPRGAGPYGITTTPKGDVYYASLAGSHVARINTATGRATVLQPPTRRQGARRVWTDSTGRIWVSEWNAGKVAVYDPRARRWREWRLPGTNPQPYAVFVDDRDVVWLTDFGANAIVRFDPRTSRFDVVRLPTPDAAVRQLLGRAGRGLGCRVRRGQAGRRAQRLASVDGAVVRHLRLDAQHLVVLEPVVGELEAARAGHRVEQRQSPAVLDQHEGSRRVDRKRVRDPEHVFLVEDVTVGELGGAGDRAELESFRACSPVPGQRSDVGAERRGLFEVEIAGLDDRRVPKRVLPDGEHVEDPDDPPALQSIELRQDFAFELVAGKGEDQ